MTYQTVMIVFCVICLSVMMIVVGRLRLGRESPKVAEWRKLPEMRGPTFLV